MNLDAVLRRYQPKPSALLAFGFVKQTDGFYYQKPLGADDLYAEVRIQPDTFRIHVYDAKQQERFFLFDVESAQGSFLLQLRKEARALAEEIIASCFTPVCLREQILDYAKRRYGSEPQRPWAKDPQSITLNTKENGRWYALLLNIPAQSLQKEQSGRVDILNLKHPPTQIEHRIDHKIFFPAYHMNKTHWLTIKLDPTADLEQLYDLLDISYALAAKKNGKK